jgi:hypothetical protein
MEQLAAASVGLHLFTEFVRVALNAKTYIKEVTIAANVQHLTLQHLTPL